MAWNVMRPREMTWDAVTETDLYGYVEGRRVVQVHRRTLAALATTATTNDTWHIDVPCTDRMIDAAADPLGDEPCLVEHLDSHGRTAHGSLDLRAPPPWHGGPHRLGPPSTSSRHGPVLQLPQPVLQLPL